MAVSRNPQCTKSAAEPSSRRPNWPRRKLVRARNLVQLAFAAFLVYSGWRFSLFVAHFTSGGQEPYVTRPAVVDAFLPIGALVALRAWLSAGVLDRVHPAGLVLLVAILISAFLFRRGFCSWICPIGTLEEAFATLGHRLLGRNLKLPSFIDWPLRGVKYLIMAFFLKSVLIDMPPMAAAFFLSGDYNKVVDVRMLSFFVQMSQGTAIFLVALGLISIPFANFWCRYLCPYGALLGLLSAFGPLAVVRNPARCTDCGRCTSACPNCLNVATLRRVSSPECTGCLNCVATCRRRGALDLRIAIVGRVLQPWRFPVLLVGSLLLVVAAAQILGYWQSGLSYPDYLRLIPKADTIGH